MATNTNAPESEQWLEIDVCLMNKQDQEDKTAGLLAADKVNMLQMTTKVDTGCRELALSKNMVEQLKLAYVDTVEVSSSTDKNVPIERYGSVLIYWEGVVYDAVAYCMPFLDSALLGLRPLLAMKPDFDWRHSRLKRGILRYTNKQYYISFNDIEKVIDSDDKIEYFEKEFGVKVHLTNEGGSKMTLTICAIRFDVNIDDVARVISHFAPSIKPLGC